MVDSEDIPQVGVFSAKLFMNYDEFKNKAILLRKQGKTYSEIMGVIPVAKSTISLWLREVGLSMAQRQNISEKRRQAQKRGADTQHKKRIAKQAGLIENAAKDVGSISKRELWLIGIALYWAEGSKEKEYRPGSGVSFSNSDPRMIAMFFKWLEECIKIKENEIVLSIYIHESHRYRIESVRRHWSNILYKPRSLFKSVYYKKNKIKTKRKNIGDLYNGLLRVNIKASSSLNRRITGWILGIAENCGIV